MIGHPFNPPHIIPLVEIVGGAETFRGNDRSGHVVLWIDR